MSIKMFSEEITLPASSTTGVVAVKITKARVITKLDSIVGLGNGYLYTPVENSESGQTVNAQVYEMPSTAAEGPLVAPTSAIPAGNIVRVVYEGF